MVLSEYMQTSRSFILSIFFEEISVSLNKAILKYQNIIIMGDFNITLEIKGIGFDKLDEFATCLV